MFVIGGNISENNFHEVYVAGQYFCCMIRIYGIHNCDTMQKAIKWLNAKGIEYEFHNYKEEGVSSELLERWLHHFPVDKLVNTRSTTYRELPDAEKSSISNKASAISLMMNNTSVIKRPVCDFGNGKFLLGWDEKAVTNLLAGE